MLLRRINIQPNEVFAYRISYDRWLATGETITGVTSSVESTPPSDVVSPAAFAVTALLVDPSDSRAVMFNAGGGDDGGVYKVTLRIQTTEAQVREDEIEFSVRET